MSATRRRQLVHLVPLRLTADEIEYLDDMMVDGGWRSRAELIRSLVRSIIEDDKAMNRQAA
jgi:metal-responsive CopG/Arc/MetJ family transcriptional regulator